MDEKNNYLDEYYTDQEKLINSLSFLATSGTYVFRGYNKQDQLLPIIIRDIDFSDFEAELLNRFEKYGSHYFSANTPIDFLSYGQHYGLPTRLLDFSHNPFIALSFALFSKKSTNYKEKEDKEYYYICYCSLEENICLKGIPTPPNPTFDTYKLVSISKECIKLLNIYSQNLNNQNKTLENYIKGLYECDNKANDLKTYEREVRKKIELKKLCFIDPNLSNQRIIMQQGIFLLPYVLSQTEHLDLIHKNTSVIKIHRDLREPLLKYLDTLGYNTFRLMPDLPSICSAVTQKVKDIRSAQSTLFKKINKTSSAE
jgi:hypothetical protein